MAAEAGFDAATFAATGRLTKTWLTPVRQIADARVLHARCRAEQISLSYRLFERCGRRSTRREPNHALQHNGSGR
jgi:hypothetical protein